MSDGSEFSIDLSAKGGEQYVSAADALANLSDKLTQAGSDAIVASEAMKAGQAAYDQAEAAANKAAVAVEKIGIAVDAQKGKAASAAEEYGLFSPQFQKASDKLAQLTARQSEAVIKASAATAAMNAEAASLDKLKTAADAAAEKEAKLVKQEAALKEASDAKAKSDKAAADATNQSVGAAGLLEGAFAKLGGPLGAIGQKASGVGGAVLKMGKSLGAAGPYVAAAVLALAVATAFVGATLAITKFGIASADSARTQALMSDGIAGSVAGGRQLDAKLDELGNTIPLARDELTAMASDLAKSGLKGDALTDALETAAIKAAKLKFGPDFAKQMLSLDNQSLRLKKGISGIFSGLKIDGFLEALSKGVDLFDKNSASAKAIKAVFESLFQPIVDGMTALIPKVIATFIQIEILALKALIAIKPYGAVLEAIGLGFLVLGAVVVAIVAIFVGAGIAMVAAFAALLALPFLLKSGFDYVFSFLKGISLASIGTAMIDGLVSGITSAGPKVLSALTGIASSAVDGVKNFLGIHSPSTLLADDVGENMGDGVAVGVDKSASGVEKSLEALVTPPDAPAGGGVTASGGGGGGGATYYVTINGGGDAQSNVTAFREWLASIGAQAGTAVPSVV